jgi:hypothetical protein
MRRAAYANVVATLALVVAVGGTSYAAAKITGKDVKNGSLSGKDVKDASLTGKDLKKQSVPLDRLSGSLPTQLDPGQFVPSTGLYTVSVGPNAWQSLGAGLERTNVFGAWQGTTPSGSSVLMLDPSLPTTIAGKPMRLRAVTACWDDTPANIVITDVIVSTFREDANATLTDINELEDPTDQNVKTCKRYDVNPPVILAANSRVNLKLSVGWQLPNATFHLGGASFELDRA